MSNIFSKNFNNLLGSFRESFANFENFLKKYQKFAGTILKIYWKKFKNLLKKIQKFHKKIEF